MIFWSVFTGLTMIGVGLHMLFFYRLRRDCPEEWVRLGSPNPFLPNNAQMGWVITKYVLLGRFERLPDKRLVNVGRALRCYDWFYITGFFALTAVFFYAVFP